MYGAHLVVLRSIGNDFWAANRIVVLYVNFFIFIYFFTVIMWCICNWAHCLGDTIRCRNLIQEQNRPEPENRNLWPQNPLAFFLYNEKHEIQVNQVRIPLELSISSPSYLYVHNVCPHQSPCWCLIGRGTKLHVKCLLRNSQSLSFFPSTLFPVRWVCYVG